MNNVNLDLQRSLIKYAFMKGEITKEQYNKMLSYIKLKEEEFLYQNKLKEFHDKEIIKKYSDYATT